MSNMLKKLLAVILTMTISIGIVGVAEAAPEGDILDEQALLQQAVDNGIINQSDYSKDKEATRSEVAGILGRAIGVADTGTTVNFVDVSANDANFKEISAMSTLGIIQGDGGAFRPNDHMTREELAVVIERIYKAYFNEIYYEAETEKMFQLDADEISEWAKQSVANVKEFGIMMNRTGRRFAPKSNATIGEITQLAVKIHALKNESNAVVVADAKSNPTADYEVYQTGGLVASSMVGFGVVARFNDTPGKIYISRTTTKPENETTLANYVQPVSFARIIDPDGNVVIRVDLDYISSGTMAKEINIPDGKPGIWQIQVVGGRNKDICGIGINGAVSWGIRGEPYFTTTNTTPKDLYMWSPEKIVQVAIGSTGPIKLQDVNGRDVATSTAGTTTYGKQIILTGLEKNTVYKLKPGMDSQTICIKGLPKLLCPTAEMAEDLKGNYRMTEDGIQVMGPLQERARKAAVDLYNKRNGNFDIEIERPDEMPEIEGNALTEISVLGDAGVASIQTSTSIQNLDVTSPYLGAVSVTAGDATWEEDYGNRATSSVYLAGTSLTESSLNYAYGNQAIIDRATLHLLWTIYSTRDLLDMNDSTPSNTIGHHYYFTHSNFYLESITASFYRIKNQIDPEYRDIIQTGIECITDKQMQARGNSPTNQYFHGVISAMYMYLATGKEHYHTYFKRGIEYACSEQVSGSSVGMSPSGYFIEEGGCDGNYYHMNITFLGAFYHDYCKKPLGDEKTKEIIMNAIDKVARFESMFWGHEVDKLDVPEPNHFTSRIPGSSIKNRGGQTGFSKLVAVNPIYKAIGQRVDTPAAGLRWPYFVSTDKSAREALAALWEKYDHTNDGVSGRRSGGIGDMGEVYFESEEIETALLPCDIENTIFEDVPGMIAINYNGLYMMSFYDNMVATEGQKSLYGGGPSMISSKYTGGVLESENHKNASATKYGKSIEDVRGVCMFKQKLDGTHFVTGDKTYEQYKLEWIEEGKKFRIYADSTEPGIGRTFSWTYEITADGLKITASVGALSDEDWWVCMPVMCQPHENYVHNYEPGKITLSYTKGQTTIEWDGSLEHTYDEVNTRYEVNPLKVKFPSSGEITFTFKTSEAK